MIMDIVIPLGSGSPWQDNELRYCLRGIATYLAGYGNIFIVGHKPEWLQNVIHIPFDEVSLAAVRESNICMKVMEACSRQDLSNDFLFFNDDHFLLRPVIADQFPYYHCGLIADKLKDCKSFNPYRKTLRNSIALLGNAALNYDVHCPVTFNQSAYLGIMNLTNWNKPYGYLMKSIYCNRMKVQGEYLQDCKINVKLTEESIEDIIRSLPFFSVGNAGLNDAMKNTLQRLYPHPCEYEKTK